MMVSMLDGEGSAYPASTDRKSTRLNSSHLGISYAVFCLKKKKTKANQPFSTPDQTISNTAQILIPGIHPASAGRNHHHKAASQLIVKSQTTDNEQGQKQD